MGMRMGMRGNVVYGVRIRVRECARMLSVIGFHKNNCWRTAMNIRKSPRRRVQVTCRCHAYHFPHRLGGGQCTAEPWVESYQLYVGTACAGCIYSTSFPCEVAQGLESIRYCEGYQDYLHRLLCIRLPMSEQDLAVLFGDGAENY
jgi:hypothetical protein